MFERRLTRQAAHLMTIEYLRIHKEAHRLFYHELAAAGMELRADDSRELLHPYFRPYLENLILGTHDYEHAKTLYSRLTRPDTTPKNLLSNNCDLQEHAKVLRALNSKIDFIHIAANSAIRQAWKQLQESGI